MKIYGSRVEKYDIFVAICAMAGSRKFIRWECSEPEEIAERRAFARAHPIVPVILGCGVDQFRKP